jgi:hypothetical protein
MNVNKESYVGISQEAVIVRTEYDHQTSTHQVVYDLPIVRCNITSLLPGEATIYYDRKEDD